MRRNAGGSTMLRFRLELVRGAQRISTTRCGALLVPEYAEQDREHLRRVGMIVDDEHSMDSLCGCPLIVRGHCESTVLAEREVLGDRETCTDHAVAVLARFVRLDHAGAKFYRMGFGHALPDQNRILDASPRISSGEHWG